MEKIDRPTLSAKLHPVLEVDVLCMLANLANVVRFGARRGSLITEGIDHESMLELALAPKSAWVISQADLAAKNVGRFSWKDLNATVTQWVNSVIQPSTWVADISVLFTSALKGLGNGAHSITVHKTQPGGADSNPTHVSDPFGLSAGPGINASVITPFTDYKYASPLVAHTVSAFDAAALFSPSRRWDMPSPYSNWNRMIARLCIAYDAASFTAEFIVANPGIEPGVRHDDMLLLHSRLAEWVHKSIASYILYSLQGTLLYAGVEKSLFDLCWAKAISFSNATTVQRAVEFKASRDFVQSAVPVHPIIGFILSALNKPTISTLYGKHDLAVSHVGLADGAFLDQTIEAINYDDRVTYKWGHAPNTEWTSPPQLQASLSSLGLDILQFAKDAAIRLKWAPISAKPVHIDQHGVSGIFTDGQGFSADPVSALLGLEPVFAVSNVKQMGDRNAISTSHFNTCPSCVDENNLPVAAGFSKTGPSTQSWVNTGKEFQAISVMPVDGYWALGIGEPLTLRGVIPESVFMGEATIEGQFSTAVAERTPALRLATRAWNERCSGSVASNSASFVPLFYRDPVPSAASASNLQKTDWESYFTNSNELNPLLTAYPRMATYDEVTWYINARFAHRVPLKISRKNHVQFLSEDMKLVDDVGFAGNVLWDASVDQTFPAYMNTVQAVVDMLPVRVDRIDVATQNDLKWSPGDL